MTKNASFKDINFKLLVIQKLMYEDKVLKPAFDVEDFVQNFEGREIVLEDEGYEIIPEVLDYFKKLKVPASLLENIEELFQDPENQIYKQICPFWDGEDDQFNIASAKDASLLPNLKKVTLFFDAESDLEDQFKELGIDLEWL